MAESFEDGGQTGAAGRRPGLAEELGLELRKVWIGLRTGGLLEGNIYFTEGVPLLEQLVTHSFVNLIDVAWAGRRGASLKHVAVKLTQILWLQADSLIDPGPRALASYVERPIRVLLESGAELRGMVYTSRRQRVSDVLQTTPGFIVLSQVEPSASHAPRGEMAINRQAIVAAWEPASERP